MKRGDKVFVCYDGKWGRRVVGEVLATAQTSRIQVRFQEYAGDRQLGFTDAADQRDTEGVRTTTRK